MPGRRAVYSFAIVLTGIVFACPCVGRLSEATVAADARELQSAVSWTPAPIGQLQASILSTTAKVSPVAASSVARAVTTSASLSSTASIPFSVSIGPSSTASPTTTGIVQGLATEVINVPHSTEGPTTTDSTTVTTTTTLPTQLPWASPDDKPSSKWPDVTAELSNAAWPNGRQPMNMQAWQMDSGKPAPCWLTSVVEDVHDNWPAQCTGLAKTAAVSLEDCSIACKSDSACSVWEYLADVGCHIGQDPHFCDVPHGDQEGKLPIAPVGAQRIQHGAVRVLKDLTGLEIMNLQQLGVVPVNGSEHCRKYCYSDLRCEYWIYSKTSGCWASNPAYMEVQYPLVLGSGAKDTGNFATSVVAGEYIMHYCPEQGGYTAEAGGTILDAAPRAVPADATAGTPESEGPFSSISVPYMIGVCVLFVALIACLGFLVYFTCKKKRPKTKRDASVSQDSPRSSSKSQGTHFQPLMEDSMVVSEGDLVSQAVYAERPNSPVSPRITPTSTWVMPGGAQRVSAVAVPSVATTASPMVPANVAALPTYAAATVPLPSPVLRYN